MTNSEQILSLLEENLKVAQRMADEWRDAQKRYRKDKDYFGAECARHSVMGYEHECITLELIMAEVRSCA